MPELSEVLVFPDVPDAAAFSDALAFSDVPDVPVFSEAAEEASASVLTDVSALPEAEDPEEAVPQPHSSSAALRPRRASFFPRV